MKRLLTISSTAVILSMALSACGGGSDTETSTAPASSSPTVTPSNTPVEPTGAPTALPLGSKATVPQGSITTYKVIYPFTNYGVWEPDKGKKYAVADIKMCAGAATWDIDFMTLDWFVTDSKGRAWQSLDSSGQPKEPDFYNQSDKLSPGECKRAWMAWDVATGTKLVNVKWADDEGTALWAIS